MPPSPDIADAAPRKALSISIVVPVLNEAPHLPACLAPLQAARGAWELIVVDGGSQDGSTEVAAAHGARVLRSPVAQRATQMNFGAAHARHEVLVFLHADTVLPDDWLTALQREFAIHPEAVGGVFRRRFTRNSSFLRLTCGLADWRARQFGWFLGDQTIFVRRNKFHSLGGFVAQRAFEDLDFSLRLRALGSTFVVPTTAMSSGRRFDAKGPLVQTFLDVRATMDYFRTRRRTADDRGAG